MNIFDIDINIITVLITCLSIVVLGYILHLGLLLKRFYIFCSSLTKDDVFINYSELDDFTKRIKSKIVVEDIFKSDDGILWVTVNFDADNDGSSDANLSMSVIDFYKRLTGHGYKKMIKYHSI